MVGIQPAGVRQHPKLCLLEQLRLRADRGPRLIESETIRSDSHNRYRSRAITADLPCQSLPPSPKLIGVEFGRARRRPGNQIGDTDPIVEQESLLPGAHQPVGKACQVKRRPESIARAGEVMPGCGGIESGIDAAEEDIQSWPYQVRNCSPLRRGQLGTTRAIFGRGSSPGRPRASGQAYFTGLAGLRGRTRIPGSSSVSLC